MVSTFETNVSLHEPLSGYSSETESDSSMDFLQVYMMNLEEEADVEHPPIVEEAEPEVPFQTPTFNPSTYTNISSQGFSFDGVPPSKWLDKLYEIHAWCQSSLLAPNATVTEVITKCTAKFLGHLHQWYISWCISTNAAPTRSQYRHSSIHCILSFLVHMPITRHLPEKSILAWTAVLSEEKIWKPIMIVCPNGSISLMELMTSIWSKPS